MGFTSLFKHSKDGSPPPEWLWPSMCNHPVSHSFESGCHPDEDWRRLLGDEEELVHSIVKDPTKDRLFFEPTKDVGLIVEKTRVTKGEGWGERECPFEKGVVVVVVVVVQMPKDPYVEFRVAMEEMVVARGGAVDCKWLQEMLEWYLRLNSKANHVYIVEAFMDLVLNPALFVILD